MQKITTAPHAASMHSEKRLPRMACEGRLAVSDSENGKNAAERQAVVVWNGHLGWQHFGIGLPGSDLGWHHLEPAMESVSHALPSS
ncbi:hypothetical protein C499_00310 [Halogeometricum borinquense DSM 11551]|uniref:Uncharacterized protein n=1 Tax=Halogeometricum borinquense (strain ATCC 700274 / DSM 11551 / JCM 10706 / KCTC 4070 / PR3) TaxID=469382 RepID=L9V3N6_HALBP|nr:hypothetical protein C499_00310 [Halogeometricum borinquense DSM 11551]